MSDLKKELDKMEKEGIINSTNLIHNLVIVKMDGSLHLCLDPKNLNKYHACITPGLGKMNNTAS